VKKELASFEKISTMRIQFQGGLVKTNHQPNGFEVIVLDFKFSEKKV